MESQHSQPIPLIMLHFTQYFKCFNYFRYFEYFKYFLMGSQHSLSIPLPHAALHTICYNIIYYFESDMTNIYNDTNMSQKCNKYNVRMGEEEQCPNKHLVRWLRPCDNKYLDYLCHKSASKDDDSNTIQM